LAYLLVLPGSRARIVRCGKRYDPQLVKRSSEWVSELPAWQGTKFAVFIDKRNAFCLILNLLCICCPVTDVSATVTLIGVKFCTMVHIGSETIFSTFWDCAPKESQIFGLNFCHLTANISKKLSRSSTKAFQNCKLQGDSLHRSTL